MTKCSAGNGETGVVERAFLRAVRAAILAPLRQSTFDVYDAEILYEMTPQRQ
jgi:hypothetical protein